MTKPQFDRVQSRFCDVIRHPKANNMMQGVALYHELLVNNLSEILQHCFPVLKQILQRQQWYDLIRHFLREHPAKTALFHELPAEFVQYLAKQNGSRLPYPFIAELAHYEWIELALEILEDIAPEPLAFSAIMDKCLYTSKLACLCQYAYPVHRISRRYLPREASAEPTWILADRNAHDIVEFIHCNRASARLWQLLDTQSLTGTQALHVLQKELSSAESSTQKHIEDLLSSWYALGLLTT